MLFAYEEAIGFGPGDVVFEKVGAKVEFSRVSVAICGRDGRLAVMISVFSHAAAIIIK